MRDGVNDPEDCAKLLFCPFDGDRVTSDLLSLVRSDEFKDFVKYELIFEIRQELN